MIGIPINTLPTVKDTYGEFCTCPEELFGAPIPVTAVVADQQSAMFAQGCWSPGDIKVTLGTGMFFDVNTGSKPHTSLTGFLPLVGWKVKDELVYLAEGQSSDSGCAIDWGQKAGLYSSVEESADVAQSVDGIAYSFIVDILYSICMNNFRLWRSLCVPCFHWI
jgi:putative glycerol kinase 5